MLDTDFEREIYSHTRRAWQPQAEGETLFTTFADRVVRRIDDLLGAWLANTDATRKQRSLLIMLRPCVGLAQAIPAGELCERLKVSPRELKQHVHDLRLYKRVQIGASRDGEAGGYYLISNEEESIESTQQMFHQAINMLRVVHVLRSKQTAAELAGQVRLALESIEGEEVR